jgi:hypothetical protein
VAVDGPVRAPAPHAPPQTKPRAEKKRQRAEEEDEGALSQKASSRILREARLQQEELDAEAAALDGEAAGAGDLPVGGVGAWGRGRPGGG